MTNPSNISSGESDERAAFERHELHARNTYADALKAYDADPAEYQLPLVQARWEGWQARAALASPAQTPAAPSVGEPEKIAALIVRDVCETDPADPDHPDTVCVNVNDLATMIVDHIATPPAAPAATEAPSGFQTVPVEPTEEMMNAGLYQSSKDSEWADVYSMWKDMLAVAAQTTDATPAPAAPASVQPLPAKARDLNDGDMDAVVTAIKELNDGDIGFHGFCDRIIALATPVQPVPVAIQSLIDDLMLEAERFWWNDGPEGKTADAMNAAKAKLLEAVQPVQASLSDALLGAANYIDVLGGDSQKYRAALASSTPTKGGEAS